MLAVIGPAAHVSWRRLRGMSASAAARSRKHVSLAAHHSQRSLSVDVDVVPGHAIVTRAASRIAFHIG